MEAQSNFNKRTARTIDVDASVMRARLSPNSRPIVLWLRAGNSRSRLVVTMTEREAKALAAELYAASDGPAKEDKETCN